MEKDMIENGGSQLLQKFHHSLPKLLLGVYPQHKWRLSQFERIPYKFWEDYQLRKDAIDSMGKELHLINSGDLLSKFGTSWLSKYGSVERFIRSVYPNHLLH